MFGRHAGDIIKPVLSYDENIKRHGSPVISYDPKLQEQYRTTGIPVLSKIPIEEIERHFDTQWNYPQAEPKLDDPKHLEQISNANILYESAEKSKKASAWKDSTQHYNINQLANTRQLQKEIRYDDYRQKPPVIFPLSERGKTRLIKSNHIRDRVIQKALNDQILFPAIEPRLIYDNGASRLNMGLSHSRNRFKMHLQSAYRRWGYDCYILLMDFSKYFDNIVHQSLLEIFGHFLDPDYLAFVANRLKEFEVDVSYMEDEEYDQCMVACFNSLEYDLLITNDMKTGDKMMPKSVGIGSQTSQIIGLSYPYELDNLMKIVCGIKEYARYMDDSYIICKTREECNDILNDLITPKCEELGIHINQKKTHVLKINNPISFLKINYILEPSSRIIEKVQSATFRREHRRLTKFRHLVDRNTMTLEDALNCYKGWLGTYSKFDSGYEILKINQYFMKLFPEFNYKFVLLQKGVQWNGQKYENCGIREQNKKLKGRS